MDDKILWDIIDGLRDELNIAQDGITDLNDVVKDLQAEAIEQIKDNNSFHGQYDEIERLNSVNVELCSKLQAVNDDYNNDHKVHNEYEDGLLAEIKELKAELSKFQSGNAKEYVDKLKAEKVRLMEQVNSNRGNSSSSHTIQKEIQDYMSHNPKSKGVRLFLLPIESFDGNGIYDANYGDVYYSDGIE